MPLVSGECCVSLTRLPGVVQVLPPVTARCTCIFCNLHLLVLLFLNLITPAKAGRIDMKFIVRQESAWRRSFELIFTCLYNASMVKVCMLLFCGDPKNRLLPRSGRGNFSLPPPPPAYKRSMYKYNTLFGDLLCQSSCFRRVHQQ